MLLTVWLLLLPSLSVMSDSLWPHGLKLPCPSPSPQVCANSCPLSQWCHPTISSSVTPFSSCPQSVPTSGSFLMSQLFGHSPGGQNTGASASVLPMNIHSGFLSGGQKQKEHSYLALESGHLRSFPGSINSIKLLYPTSHRIPKKYAEIPSEICWKVFTPPILRWW